MLSISKAAVAYADNEGDGSHIGSHGHSGSDVFAFILEVEVEILRSEKGHVSNLKMFS